MTSYRVGWLSSAILCAIVVIPTLGCSGDVEHLVEPSSVALSALSGCREVDSSGTWWNQDFPDQAGQFTVELDATPSADALDAVVGLSAGEAQGFTALAAIVRFNDAGMIDVRAGSGYRADVPYAYAAGHRYHLRIAVNVSAHSYTVAVLEGSGAYTTIATAYPFRTEQANAARLNHVAGEVDSAAGPLEVCGVSVILPNAGTCVTAHAGDGFVGLPLPDAMGYETVLFTAQASGTDIDAVFGLSAGPATRFSDLAAAVRFAPSGRLDVRDGGGYRADLSNAYTTTAVRLRMISDLTTHTYSVFQDTAGLPPADVLEIARQFRFRTEQAGATHLDHLGVIVDGDHGSAIICATASVPSNVLYSREGGWTAVPFANDEALLSNGATTSHVDATGHLLATLDHSGVLATDALGNAYLASIANETLTVEKYARPLALQWSTTFDTATLIRGIVGLPDGSAVVAVRTSSDPTTTQVLRFAPDGSIASTQTIPGAVRAIDGDRAFTVLLDSDNQTLRIAAYSLDGTLIWERTFAGSASISAIAVGPAHDLIFGGEFFTAIDFGGGPLRLVRTDDGPVNGYVAKLSSTGEHVFSTRTGYTSLVGIATNGQRIAMSGTRRTQFFYLQLAVFDANRSPGENAQLFDNGRGGAVAMSPSGRLWWSFEDQFRLFAAFPYMLALQPR